MLESEDILSVTSEVLNAGVCCICSFFQMELAGDTCGSSVVIPRTVSIGYRHCQIGQSERSLSESGSSISSVI